MLNLCVSVVLARGKVLMGVQSCAWRAHNRLCVHDPAATLVLRMPLTLIRKWWRSWSNFVRRGGWQLRVQLAVVARVCGTGQQGRLVYSLAAPDLVLRHV